MSSNNLKIKNPELEFNETPKLRKKSKIISFDKSEYRRGIILDSIDEFGDVLKIYYSGRVPSSRATEQQLVKDISRDSGGMAGVFASMGMSLSERRSGDSFIENLIKNVETGLKTSGRFHKHFDYDGIGVFFKTSVEANKINGKYILGLNAAYVGTEPENNLAAFISKPRALYRADAKAVMSIVDDWWFNINLEDAVKNLPFCKERISEVEEWVKYLEDHNNGKAPSFTFEHDGNKFQLRIGLDASTYLKPANREIEEEYISVRGKNIAGAAWKIYEGNNQIPPTPQSPSLDFSVSFTKEKDAYDNKLAVSEEEMRSIYGARDYISELISKN